MPRAHVIGAGLAGLSAACRLAERGVEVVLYEGAGQAGGRCRSFFDKTLDREIDNGNHLIMSGNGEALGFLDLIGSRDALIWPERALYPFVDIRTNARWTIDINNGPAPTWILDPARRVPNTTLTDYLKAARIAFAGSDETVADVADLGSPLYEAFWEPLTLAVLNTTPQRGQAKLLWTVIRKTFARGAAASRPLIAREGLGPAFVASALDYLKRAGVTIRFNARARKLSLEEGAIAAIHFADESVVIDEGEEVVLAVPPTRLKQLMPALNPPADDASILNVHFRAPMSNLSMSNLSMSNMSMTPGETPFIGIIGSLAHWAFIRGDVVSVTTSAADALGADEQPNAEVVARLWREVKAALGIEGAYEKVRVIREKRATPDQSPAGVRKRLAQTRPERNLVLAGDHTNTGLPATIEGSILSGRRAADLVARRLGE